MPKKTISDVSMMLIRILFMDESIKRSLVDEKDNTVYSRVDIGEDGSITFGKTKFRWWNRLVNDEKTVPFNAWIFDVVKALAGQQANCSDIIRKGLSQEVVDKAIFEGDYDMVVDRLFDAARYGVKTKLNTRGFSISDKISGHVKIHSHEGDKDIVLPGSGDILCRVSTGITGVEVIRD